MWRNALWRKGKVLHMLRIDYWYGDKRSDVTSADVFFQDNEGRYFGWLHKENETIGDFECNDSVALEKEFPGIFG